MSTLEQLSQPRTVQGASQATVVEQTRAMEEVRAAVVVAQQCPRDVSRAVVSMMESCRQKALAERAFFRYPRAGEQISGPSVHLARDLARCWGNIQYGIHELSRDDAGGSSEMLAYAWDVETNTRSASIFIVPHARDVKRKRQPIVELRDVYENNANMGARRVREAIFAVLPAWFTEQAKQTCHETLSGSGAGEPPVAKQAADLVHNFEKRVNVSAAQLEAKVGRPVAVWDHDDLAKLRVVAASLARGEATVSDEFPASAAKRELVTAAEITGQEPTS